MNLTTLGTWASDTSIPGVFNGDPGFQYATGALYSGGHAFLAGDQEYEESYADYFILDLTNITSNQVISSVLFNSGYFFAPSQNQNTSIQLLSTTTSPSVLEASGTNMGDVYNSLTNGTLLSGAETDGAQTFQSTGNSDFLSLLNASRGSIIAIAGYNGNTSKATETGATPSFTVTTVAVPEPSGLSLLCLVAIAPILLLRNRIGIGG